MPIELNWIGLPIAEPKPGKPLKCAAMLFKVKTTIVTLFPLLSLLAKCLCQGWQYGTVRLDFAYCVP